MQPRRSAGLQLIWTNSQADQRSDYAAMLCNALQPYFQKPISASLAAKSNDVAVIKLTINSESDGYREDTTPEFSQFLHSVKESLPVTMPGNVQLMPDLRFVIGADMYLVKPMQLRHWLRSTALADAEQIAAEFSVAVARHSQDGGLHVGR